VGVREHLPSASLSDYQIRALPGTELQPDQYLVGNIDMGKVYTDQSRSNERIPSAVYRRPAILSGEKS